LLAEELEHACPRQAVGQRGGLLLRARRPQRVQQRGSCRRRASAGGPVNPPCRRSAARAAHSVRAPAQRPVAVHRYPW
jgi:hypothetical protein